MKHAIITIAEFKNVLIHTDWEAKNRSTDPAVRINGLTPIAHAADCFVVLAAKDHFMARRLLRDYLPHGWKGWPIVVRAAQISRKAFEKAVSVGTFSDNRQADNYYGHYFYTHSAGGQDFFKHRRTFLSVESPYSKAALAAYASKKIFWSN